MNQLPVWGIDLTAANLRAVRLSLDASGKPRADAWDAIDFAEDVEDVRGVGRYDAMSKAVKRFLKHQDVRNARTIVSIRGETAFNRTVTAPQLNDESLDKILGYEAQQQIPYPLDDVYWDRRVVGLKEGGDVTVTLYAIRKQQVDDRIRKLHLMHLPVDAVQLRPLALQNFCAAERLLEHGTAVVDFDYAGLQILVCHDDRTWFRCLPTGACDFVERLKSKFRLDHASAVRLATGQTAPKPSQAAAFAALRAAAAEETAAEVAGQIRYYRELHDAPPITRIHLFEAHAACPPLADALRAATGVETHRPMGFKSLAVEGEVVAVGLQDNFAGLARAAGLALQGVGKADTAVRLYPDTIPRTFSRRKAGYLPAAACLLVMAVVGYSQRAAPRARFEELNVRFGAKLDAVRREPRDRVERAKLADDPVKPVIDRWTARAGAREGRTPWLRALLDALKAAPGRDVGAAPLLVAFETGDAPGRALKAGVGRLVLAHVENAAPAEVDARLDAFAASLVGKEGLKSAKPSGDGWSAAAPRSVPGGADDRLLRFRFRHRAYDLAWEDAR
ncbi:MAG TPA: pilus assembly protein PilM [Planctomycetota bacterium]|nr:pilus assembly protein PilM [Planctomycetota bacterium]